jgi:hypothetical protein
VTDLLVGLRGSLRERLERQHRSFVWTHGDFGYGNVLANMRTGRLTGVIDWDQGLTDIAGVDLVNLLFQRERMRKGFSLSEAVSEVGSRIIRGGFASVDRRIDFESHFPESERSRAEIVAWSIWRFVERDIRYPQGFTRARGELCKVLQWARCVAL